MRSINCQTLRREIEGAGSAEHLNDAAIAHLNGCDSCATLARQQGRLQAILANLGTVEAPGDFDFKLRARLAAEGNGRSAHSIWLNFSFGQRSAVTAMALVLIVAGVAFFSLRQPSNETVSTIAPANPGVQLIASGGASATEANKPVESATVSPVAPPKGSSSPQRIGRQDYLAVHGNRSGSRDMSIKPAKVFRYDQDADTSGAFPINASYQSLKVSIDDGHSTRTISLPSVSFGSQAGLSQNQPLMASARGSW